jgi:pimeloyl-ACP methyl ester carboxylesterase
MEAVTVNGLRLAYDTVGKGAPVLLIGGLGMPPAAWHFSQVQALESSGYRVITFGNRGMTPSASPPPPYTVAQMAADTASLIEHLELVPCRVVGMSLGGFITEELCRTRPELVRAAVLIASACRTTAFVRAAMRAERELFAARPVPRSYDLATSLLMALPSSTLQDDNASVSAWVAFLDTRSPWTDAGRRGQYEAAWSWLLDPDQSCRFSGVTAPCLVMAFEHDLYFPPSQCADAAAEMPHGEFVEIAGAAHAGIFHKPDEVNDALLKFLARH